MIRKLVGNRIRQLRKERKLTQDDLADLSLLDRTYITSVERGHRNISIVNLEKISKALNIEIKELFDF